VSDQPTQLPPVEAEIHDIEILADNAVWVRLRFPDDSYLAMEFAQDSPVAHEILESVDRGVNDSLRRLGQRGVTLTGFTAPEPSGDER
jgi:hypothetical protein